MDELPNTDLQELPHKSVRRRTMEWWFGAHYNYSSERDFTMHTCVRFGKVRHAYIVGRNGVPHEFAFEVEHACAMMSCNTWDEAMALLRAHEQFWTEAPAEHEGVGEIT